MPQMRAVTSGHIAHLRCLSLSRHVNLLRSMLASAHRLTVVAILNSPEQFPRETISVVCSLLPLCTLFPSCTLALGKREHTRHGCASLWVGGLAAAHPKK